jgi:uncharacterized protein (DUF305 family)
MPTMYKNKKYNLLIAFASIVIFASSLAALRSQTFVTDEQYMKAMIPHHSTLWPARMPILRILR